MNSNRQYKDSVFSLLFGNPPALRELYGALSGQNVPPDTAITINTLQNALFMERINDISFTIGDKLVVLIEHQSTINPNMPLRLLLYVARIYEKIIESENLYTSQPIRIPRPEFFVLYNGKEECPDEETLKLSDAFRDMSEAPELELAVKVYNINEGRNEVLLRRSENLSGYAEFVGTTRELEGLTGSRREALEGAVKRCIEKGILKEFLSKNGSEVVNMLLTEWNWDDARRVWERDAAQKAARDTRKATEKESVRKLMKFGMPPEQIAQALELPLETVKQYLGQ
jgi:predicted transposase/invertase (TIGR01784 family)